MLHYHNKPIVDSRLRPGLAFLRGGLLSVYALSRCLFLAVMCKHDVIYKTENYITYRNAARATAMGNMHKNLARSGHKFLEIRFCFKLVKKIQTRQSQSSDYHCPVCPSQFEYKRQHKIRAFHFVAQAIGPIPRLQEYLTSSSKPEVHNGSPSPKRGYMN